MKVRTRIAPSPTGPQMHIGNFRTALYSYMWAKKNNGEFILRVEDTDRKRYVKGSVESYMELFRNFGIDVDKYPSDEQIREMDEVEYPPQDWILDQTTYANVNDGDYKDIYIQTRRLHLYLKYAQQLVNSDLAYLCFFSEEELKELKDSMPPYQPFRSPHRFLTKEERLNFINEGKPFVIRLNVENYISKTGKKVVEYEDLVLGKMKFDLETIDDQVLMKSNGIPTYHLAVVIDDHNMDITHPIRGYGWLPSTPKQIMLYDMLGWEMKPFAHVTDILDPAGGKLSKRRGAVFTTEFLKNGFLKDAILNFIALVGWSPKIERKHGEKEREIFSLQEMIDLFDIDGISNANPLFDRNKLNWFNKEYIKMKSSEELQSIFVNWLEKFAEDKSMNEVMMSDPSLDKKLELVKERSTTLVEMFEQIKFFYGLSETVEWNIPQLEKVTGIRSQIIDEISVLIKGFSDDSSNWKHGEWEAGMRAIGDKFNAKHGDIFMVLRVAVCGKPFSPPLFEAIQVLGKEETLKRMK